MEPLTPSQAKPLSTSGTIVGSNGSGIALTRKPLNRMDTLESEGGVESPTNYAQLESDEE